MRLTRRSPFSAFLPRRHNSPHRARQARAEGRSIAWRGEPLESRIVLAAELVISEFMASNRDTLRDGNGDASDWIELYNAGDDPASLGDYFLTDDAANLRRWRFPNMSLGPREFLVVFASGNGQPDSAGNLHTNFGLDRDGEFVALVEGNGNQIVSQYTFGPQTTDVAFGMGQESTLRPLLEVAAEGRLRIPTNADQPIVESWKGAAAFDDSSWDLVSTGVGFGAPGGQTDPNNLAVGKNVTASGPLWPGFVPTRLTDGDRGTISHPAAPVPAFEYVIDLGEETALGRIEIYNRNDGCCPDRLTNYRVTVHDDEEGSPGPPVWTAELRTDGTNSGVGGVDVVTPELDPFGDFAGRYITVAKIDDGQQNYWPQIAEVEVFPSLGYDSWINTDIGAGMQGENATAWLRMPLTVDAPEDYQQLELSLQYDDGFVAYLNGTELARRNAPDGPPGTTTQATATHQGSATETFELPATLLRAGANLLAIQGLNLSADDNDFLLVPTLRGRQVTDTSVGFLQDPTPGRFNTASVLGFLPPPVLDVTHGLYEEAFQLRVDSPWPGATLVYTMDGRTPTLSQGQQVPAADPHTPASITLDIAGTTLLRAAIFQSDYAPSSVATQSYLFLPDILQQPARPADLPSSWAGNSSDYEMDPDVVDDPVYTDRLIEGLQSIPTLSIVTDQANLWDATDGIYINSTQRGDAWERPISLELIQADGREGFQVDAGLRMWGTGWAPHTSSRKHSFQLKFKSEYGPSKLDYPLFADAPVSAFDDIVLRAQGSRSWYDFRQPDIGQSQYIRDTWARDTARDMGKLEGHATFVHLYLNGLYWGLYNPVERTNEKFAEEYLGGDAEDYDVINKRSGQATHATSGNMTAWNEMLALADAGLESPEAYAAIQQYLDVDDFIDYMLIQQYATNHDGPDQGGNNMRALRRRDSDGRFTFHVWDMEYTFWYPGEHRNIDGDVPDSPMRLFSRLRENAEFRLRFADRVQLHFFGDGALTPENAAARWLARANEIDTAIIGESARWGDGRRPQPYTRDVEWVAERDRLLNEYFPVRTQILLDQFRRAGLFPEVDAPQLSTSSGTVPSGFELNMDATAGSVYYTLDGSDPRMPGGAVAPQAQQLTPRQPLIEPTSAVQWVVPRDGQMDATWMNPDSSAEPPRWSSAPAPIGFDIQPPALGVPVGLQQATATFSERNRSVAHTIDGDLAGRGWGFTQPVDFQGPVIRAPVAVWETQEDVGFDQGTELTFTMVHDSQTRANLGRFRLSVTGDPRDSFADGLESSGDVTANWVPLTALEFASAEGATFTILPDQSILVDGGLNRRDTYTIRAISTLPQITGVRLETIKDTTLPGRGGPGRGAGGAAVLSELLVTAAPAHVRDQLMPELADAVAADIAAAANLGAGASLYVRIPFQAESLNELDRLTLQLQFPDAFVAYLNGHEVARSGVAGAPRFDSTAEVDRPRSEMFETSSFDVSAGLPWLQAGENLLAIEALTRSAASPSMLVRAQLIGESDLGLRLTGAVSLQARTQFDGDWSALRVGNYRAVGDLTDDGFVDAADIDYLCQTLAAGQASADLTGDGLVDQADVDFLVRELLKSRPGDANLDGVFDSADLVQIFQQGAYEDGVSANSGWAAGDWNCDRDFDSADLVVAFQEGGYVAPPAPAAKQAPFRAAIAAALLDTFQQSDRRDRRATS